VPGGGEPGTRAVLVWRFPEPVAVLTSAPVGGPGPVGWVVDIEVDGDYARTDLEVHVRQVAARLELAGPGVGLLTAAPVSALDAACDGGVVVHATVGITRPTWAAGRDGSSAVRAGASWQPGTINTVVQLPVTLSPGAAVNAVVTATEAKAQALLEAGIPGTGTASDAIAVCWPLRGAPEPFAGPRSTWGARLARAVHAATAAGAARA